MDTIFATGNVKIKLSQQDMAKAVEFWLNEKVLKQPCQVIKMDATKINNWAQFEVVLKEQDAGEDYANHPTATD